MATSFRTGLASQVMIGEETTYGVYVAPTRALEFLSVGVKADVPKLITRGIGNQFVKSGRARTYRKSIGGPLSLDFMDQGMGLLLKHALGTVVTAQVGSTAEYTHTFTPDSVGLQGRSLTMQIGYPETGSDTIDAFSYTGGKIVDWTLTSQVDQNLKFDSTWDFKNTEDLAQTLATPSYPALLTPLAFIDATLTVDGSEVSVRQATVAGKRAMNLDRRFLGNAKKEPLANGEFEITGQLDKEFEGTAEYTKFVNGTSAALVLTHSYGTIPTAAAPFSLIITIPYLEYTGGDPAINGSDVVNQTLPWKAFDNGTDPIVSLEWHTSDLTP
jgi:hypothetical protein